MLELQTLFSVIDTLSPQELEQLSEYVEQRRRELSLEAENRHAASPTFENESAEEIRAEVNAIINERLDSVKRKRETGEFAKQLEQIG